MSLEHISDAEIVEKQWFNEVRDHQRGDEGILHVSEYGVDPSKSASKNTENLNSALSDVKGQGSPAVLHFPRGKIKLDPPDVTGKDALVLQGATPVYGYDNIVPATTLQFESGTTGLDLSGSGENETGVVVRNLSINGTSTLETGVHVYDKTMVENLHIKNCTKQGVLITDGTATKLHNISAVSNSGHGIEMKGTDGRNSAIWMTNIKARSNGKNGLDAKELQNLRVVDSVFESNTGYGVRLYRPDPGSFSRARFDNCFWENNVGGSDNYQLLIDSETKNFSDGPPNRIEFRMCKFTGLDDTQRYVDIASVRFCLFDQCTFAGGDDTDGINLQTHASYVQFVDRAGGPTRPISGGNRYFEVDRDKNDAGGLEMTGGAWYGDIQSDNITEQTDDAGTLLEDNRFPTLSSDPTTTQLDDGEAQLFVSDGSSGVTGADGDFVVAINNGGIVKTKVLADFSTL